MRTDFRIFNKDLYFICICFPAHFEFPYRPKFISEEGNLIIETALDKNLTFRIRGHGIILVNDRNIMPTLLSASSSAGDRNRVDKSFETRLSETEGQVNLLSDRFDIISRQIRMSENRYRYFFF